MCKIVDTGIKKCGKLERLEIAFMHFNRYVSVEVPIRLGKERSFVIAVDFGPRLKYDE